MPDDVWMKRVLPNAEEAFRSNNRDVQARLCAGAGLAVLPRPLGDETPGILRMDVGENPPAVTPTSATTAICGGSRACVRCWTLLSRAWPIEFLYQPADRCPASQLSTSDSMAPSGKASLRAVLSPTRQASKE